MIVDFEGVHEAIKGYFDGFYASDAKALERVFHPQANLYTATDGKLLTMPLYDYLAVVEKRDSVAVTSKTETIVNVTFAGPDVAVARLNVANATTSFSDFLVLVRESDRWRIVTKAYHANPR